MKILYAFVMVLCFVVSIVCMIIGLIIAASGEGWMDPIIGYTVVGLCMWELNRIEVEYLDIDFE